MTYNNTDLAACMTTVVSKGTTTQVHTAKGTHAEMIDQLGHKVPTHTRPWEKIRKHTVNGYYVGK